MNKLTLQEKFAKDTERFINKILFLNSNNITEINRSYFIEVIKTNLPVLEIIDNSLSDYEAFNKESEAAELYFGTMFQTSKQQSYSYVYSELNRFSTISSELTRIILGLSFLIKIPPTIKPIWNFNVKSLLEKYKHISNSVIRYFTDEFKPLNYISSENNALSMEYSPQTIDENLAKIKLEIKQIHEIKLQEIKEKYKDENDKQKDEIAKLTQELIEVKSNFKNAVQEMMNNNFKEGASTMSKVLTWLYKNGSTLFLVARPILELSMSLLD